MKAIIERDQWAESPRTSQDNLSTFIFLGKHSDLGDKHDLNGDYGSYSGHEKAIRKAYDVAVLKPVYAYVHSGMTISTEQFSCPWDSGQLGFAIVTKQAIRKEYGVKRVTKEYVDRADDVMVGEVETLDKYIGGDVYSVSIYDGDEYVDGCSGYYDIEQAKNEIPDYVTKIEENL